MPLIKHKEFRDRIQTQTAFNSPGLTVQADQDAARGHGAAMFAVANALRNAGGVYVRNRIAKDEKKKKEDYEKGKQFATEKSLTGIDNPDAIKLYEASESARQGRDEIDGLRISDEWVKGVQTRLAEVEPGDTAAAQEAIQSYSKEFLANAPEGSRATLTTALGRMAPQIMMGFHKDSLIELDTQQKESGLDLARKGFLDGSLSSPEGIAKFETVLDQLTMVDKTERAELLAKAATEALESGQGDPDKLLATLDAYRPNGAIPFGRYMDELKDAAARGKAAQAKALREQQEEAFAQVAFQWDDLARTGRLSDRMIEEQGDQFGMSTEQKLMWRNRNRSAIEEAQRKAEAAAKERSKTSLLSLVISDDPSLIFESQEQIAKTLNGAMAEAMRNGDMQKVAAYQRLAMDRGYPLPYIKNVTARFDASMPEAASETIKLFENLEGQSREYAIRNADPKFLAQYETYKALTQTQRLSPERALATIAARKPDSTGTREAAAAQVRKNPKLVPFSVRNQRDATNMVTALASNYMTYGGLSPEAATSLAAEKVKADTIEVGGQLLPRNGLSNDAGPMLSRFLTEKKRELVRDSGGRYTNEHEFTFRPIDGDPGQYAMVTADDGAVVLDKGNRPVIIEPARMGQAYRAWEADTKAKTVRQRQVMKQLGLDNGINAKKTPSEVAADLRKSAEDARRKAKAELIPDSIFEPASGTSAPRKRMERASAEWSRRADELEKKAAALEGEQTPDAPKGWLDFMRSLQKPTK